VAIGEPLSLWYPADGRGLYNRPGGP